MGMDSGEHQLNANNMGDINNVINQIVTGLGGNAADTQNIIDIQVEQHEEEDEDEDDEWEED